MNKLMARIFAVVMVVVMLGTVSFAATLGTDAITDVTEPTKDGYATQTTKTILAFATNTKDAQAPDVENGDVIIAIEQLTTGIPTSLPIDGYKTANKHYITIIFSGNTPVKDVVQLDIADETSKLDALEVFATYEAEDGTVYENLAKATFTVNPESGKTLKAYGIEFAQEGSTTGKVNRLGKPVTGTEVNGGFTFTAAIVGVPENVTLTATPYLIYE